MNDTTVPTKPARSAMLLIHCPDRMGLVAAVTQFIYRNNGNILYLDQHVDSREQAFFMRVEWDLAGFTIPGDGIDAAFSAAAGERFGMQWSLHFSDERPRMAIFVSKLPHCLYDLLARCESGEWNVEVPLIVSNHPALEAVARRSGIDFQVVPVTQANKREQEEKKRALRREYRIDFVVLARYMQVLSAEFLAHYPSRVINIHHSFLPAFPGANPYRSAHERGVKIIGATSHYATPDLDAGPIIEQDVVRVSHKDTVQDLIRKGQDLEKVVLARAVWHHLQHRVLVHGNRTIIFP
jgi:formyltetrahydrofolate deformylase